jgi:hypothetical protein
MPHSSDREPIHSNILDQVAVRIAQFTKPTETNTEGGRTLLLMTAMALRDLYFSENEFRQTLELMMAKTGFAGCQIESMPEGTEPNQFNNMYAMVGDRGNNEAYHVWFNLVDRQWVLRYCSA